MRKVKFVTYTQDCLTVKGCTLPVDSSNLQNSPSKTLDVLASAEQGIRKYSSVFTCGWKEAEAVWVLLGRNKRKKEINIFMLLSVLSLSYLLP